MRQLTLLLVLCFLFSGYSNAQKVTYTPDWESLDTRPVPIWWQDCDDDDDVDQNHNNSDGDDHRHLHHHDDGHHHN